MRGLAPYTAIMHDPTPRQRHHQIDQTAPAAPIAAGLPSDDLVDAAGSFFPGASAVAEMPGRGDLAIVEDGGRRWRLRRWPVTATAERLHLVHRLLGRAHDEGVSALPTVASLPGTTGDTVLRRAGALYDAQMWPAGASLAPDGLDLPSPVSSDLLREVARTVARVHQATEQLADEPGVPALPLGAIVAAVHDTWNDQRERLRPVAPTTPPVQRWLRVGERALPAVAETLDRADDALKETSVVIHADLWPYRVVAPSDRLVALIGWDGATAGSPLLDIAQLVTHLGGWHAERAEEVLAAYHTVRPLPPELRRLLPAVAALDLVAVAGRALNAGYRRRADGVPPPHGARAGAEALVASLEAVTRVVEAGDRPTKPMARRWERGPRRSAGAAGRRSTRPAREP